MSAGWVAGTVRARAMARRRLGALATAWPRLAGTTSPAELRAALAASAWGDPGGSTPRDIQLGLRLSWAVRLAAVAPAVPWAAGAVALLAAGSRFATGQPFATGERLPGESSAGDGSAAGQPFATGHGLAGEGFATGRPDAAGDGFAAGRELPPGAVAAATIGPGRAGLARRDVDIRPPAADPARGPVGAARRVGAGRAVARRTGVVGAAAHRRGRPTGPGPVRRARRGRRRRVAGDAWQVRAALELAARGGASGEDLDAVA